MFSGATQNIRIEAVDNATKSHLMAVIALLLKA